MYALFISLLIAMPVIVLGLTFHHWRRSLPCGIWRTLSSWIMRSAKTRVFRLQMLGCFFGISTATWLTLLGNWILYSGHQGTYLAVDLVIPVAIFWGVIFVGPACLLCSLTGWHWGQVDSLNTAQLCTTLLVNAALWGTAGLYCVNFALYVHRKVIASPSIDS